MDRLLILPLLYLPILVAFLSFYSKPNLGRATSDVILLDFDYAAEVAMDVFSNRWRFVSKFRWPQIGQLKGKVDHVEVRRTYHGVHIYVYLKVKLPEMLLVLIQYALGSDFRREALNFGRIMENTKNDSNLLYTEKWAARRDGYELLSQEKLDRRLTRKLHRVVFHPTKRR